MGKVIPFTVPFEALGDYEATTTPDEDPVHDAVARNLDRQRVRQLVGELPPEEGRAIRLRFGFDGEERNSAQVARAMRVRKSTALVLLRSGLDRIADSTTDLNPAA